MKSRKTKRRKAPLNKSGLPMGSTVGYIQGQSCGRGKHEFAIAKSQTYAVCVKCHLRMNMMSDEEPTDPDLVEPPF